ncbi:single-stranded DNA-binding protein [Bifidobacterium amazonense]|uniref:Single-stranded DNA-binding protein n=1 Tax=Bifidobacterium amazonense TaxID=2809027 RepID=A0ABS9VSA5_9BIFI|nr:single-stranded DNA-binding protein [Bifidobacterium amazonense]MCH9274973.1 single-stranded DNA-binding protein [Bifidobacterium amazonense]
MAGETILTIIGNLTADPELRTLGSGVNVASFTIASTPRTWNRQTNQYEDGQALFLRCSAWRELADHCVRSLSKGMRVIAQGRLQQRSYQASDGSNRTIIELQVDEIGPSLRYATAQVSRQGNNARGGYTGGASARQAPTAHANAQVAPPADGGPADPWANGGPSDFGAGDPASDPEF